MRPVELFSFGYWGWGSATGRLVEAIDAVEAARGFAPPLFVDIRISRSVRASGFNGAAFARLIGESRHRWMDALGNLGIVDGGAMRIKEPQAANELLDLAVQGFEQERRLIFFCACEKPCDCHRFAVASLVLEAARRRNLALEVVEWPGGEPRADVAITVTRAAFDKLRRGARSVPLGHCLPLAESAAIPWYSLLAVRPDDVREDEGWPSWKLLTGPAKWKGGAWTLPVYGAFDGEPGDAVRSELDRLRQRDGYAGRRVDRR